MPKTCHFFCPGDPVCKGSMAPRPSSKFGMYHTNATKLRPWEHIIALKAAEEWDQRLWGGPVQLWLRFCFHRPNAHFRSGKNSQLLKADSPTHPTAKKKNDLDKLVRAVMDALTGVVYVDDAQVWSLESEKIYSEIPGVKVGIVV